MRRALVWLLWLCCGCGDTGRERVELALSGSGTPPRTLTLAGGNLTLTRADVAFGPVYFCASESADAELCEVALAELRETVVVHTLEPAPQPLGVLRGTTGEVRSALYDYGISWLLSEGAPRASATAVEGHSAVLEGVLEREGKSVRFRAVLDVAPRERGGSALTAQRTRHEITGQGSLRVLIDPHAWVERLDVAGLFALDLDGDGLVQIEPATPGYESILQGMTSRAPATFAWSAD